MARHKGLETRTFCLEDIPHVIKTISYKKFCVGTVRHAVFFRLFMIWIFRRDKMITNSNELYNVSDLLSRLGLTGFSEGKPCYYSDG